MKHQEFVKHLNAIGYPPYGSNGCLAHISCDWLTSKNFEEAAKSHQDWAQEARHQYRQNPQACDPKRRLVCAVVQ